MKISEEIRVFLKSFVNADTGLAKIPKSLGFISPGDVLIFGYPTEMGPPASRVVLVVSNSLGEGLYTSTQNNKLLSCFRLDTSPVEVSEIILGKLYKNRRLCSYSKIISSLSTILGKNSYRTYNITKITDLQEILQDGR